MKKVLILFDAEFDPPSTLRGNDLDLLPLTNDRPAINLVRERCTALGGAVRVLETSRLVDAQVSGLRSRVLDWSADLGQRLVAGTAVKEHLLLPGGEVSAWWFSTLFEKNPLKTEVFLRLAQLQAVDELLGSGVYERLVTASHQEDLRRAIEKAAKRHRVEVRRLKKLKRHRGQGLRDLGEWMGGLGDVLHALGNLVAAWKRAWQARRVMGSRIGRPTPSDAAVFVSYFPLVEEVAAETGEFRNRYAGPLQELLAQEGRPTIWLLIYLEIQGRSYRQALELGRRFAAREPVFFIEEFLSPRSVLRAVSAWAVLLLRFLGPAGRARGDFLTKGLTIEEGAELLRPLWRRTFMGWACLRGILFFEMFRNAFKQFSSARQCLYYVEMQVWEMALNAARQVAAPGVRGVGFQHAAVSLNHFFYFHSRKETRRTGNRSDLPWPDVMACNGRESLDQFERLGYPGLREAEAVRHFRLIKAMAADEPPKPSPPVVLVIGSAVKWETAGLVSLLLEAHPKGFQIWFKPHPMIPPEAVFTAWPGPRLAVEGWVVRREQSVEPLLRDAAVVICGESSVCVDALAYGCQVIAPVMNDTLFMNPLDGHEDFYHRVYGPEDLRRLLKEILDGSARRKTLADARALVGTFWTLDPSLRRWREILNSGRNAIR